MEERKEETGLPVEEQEKSRKPRRGRRFLSVFRRLKWLGLLLLVAAVAAGTLFFSRTASTYFGSQTLAFSLKDIGELATQAGYYTDISVISKGERTFLGIPFPFTSSRALCSYSGVIKAGLDFGGISIRTDAAAKTLTLEMPEIRILSNEVDLDSLKVYDESNSVFNRIRITSVNQSLITMKEQAEAHAIENGLLTAARANAETMIRAMLTGLDAFRDYDCVFRWPEDKQEGSNP